MIKFRQQGDKVYLTVPHPSYFAIEMIDRGIHPQLNVPSAAYEGKPLTIKLALTNWTGKAARGTVRLGLPVGWSVFHQARPRRWAIPAGKQTVLAFQVSVPREPLQRTYPLSAVIRFNNGRKLDTAATVRVMRRCYLHVDHPILNVGATGRATATFINNLPVPVNVQAQVAAPAGMVVAPSSFDIHLSPASFQQQHVMLKTSPVTSAVATTKAIYPRRLQVLRIQTEKIPLSGAMTLRYSVQTAGGRQTWRKVYSWTPQVKLLSLARAAWRTRLFPSIYIGQGQYGVMGIGGGETLRLSSTDPLTSDANWPIIRVGQRVTLPKNKSSSIPYKKNRGWGVFRTWINVPESWMKYRRIRLHGVAPYIRGWPLFSFNYVFINGRPAGALGDNRSIPIGPYLYYGGKNLIAIAQYAPAGIPRLSIVAGPAPPALERAFKTQNGR